MSHTWMFSKNTGDQYGIWMLNEDKRIVGSIWVVAEKEIRSGWQKVCYALIHFSNQE